MHLRLSHQHAKEHVVVPLPKSYMHTVQSDKLSPSVVELAVAVNIVVVIVDVALARLRT